MSKDNGGPAFPQIPGESYSYIGISRRDYFAAKAMAQLVKVAYYSPEAPLEEENGKVHADKIARDCYIYADAMLQESKQ